MVESYVVGYDVGTEGIKSVLATFGGEMVACSLEPYPIFRSAPTGRSRSPVIGGRRPWLVPAG